MRTPNSLSLSAGNLLRGIVKLHQFCFLGKNVKLGRGNRINPMVVIEDDVTIGSNNFFGYGCVVRPKTVIGSNCNFGHYFVFEGGTIGNNVRLHAQGHVGIGSVIKDNVFAGPYLLLINVTVPSVGRSFPPKVEGVTIERGVRIGARTLFMPGVHVGEEALIGAGTLVTKDVPDYAIFYGHPGKVCGKVPKEHRLFSK